MTDQIRKTAVAARRGTVAALLALVIAAPAAAQSAPPAPSGEESAANATPAAPAAQDDDPDRDVNFAQPDFNLAALPTTLRVPRHKSAFRVTHRFFRPLGAGDFGDLVGDLFGLDSSALIGLEYRFGLFRGTQIGLHRTSGKTIEFFAQRQLVDQSDAFPFAVDVLAAVDGTNNFRDSYSPALGVLVSREIGERAALYFEPIWVNNSNPLPEELADDNSTFMIGLGARVRIRPTVYLLLEGAPRVAGFAPDFDHVSFGIEKRMGGHLFQLNFSNGQGTTPSQLARGGTGRDDWYLGFNISRKFF
jgi:hypothetical protein